MTETIQAAAFRKSAAILISSTIEGYLNLARIICDTGCISFGGELSPGRERLLGARVTDGPGKVEVSVDRRWICLGGPSALREIISQNIQKFCSEPATPSFHLENHPDHYFLDNRSLSIIFSRL
jgi:hypothetical protein